MILISPRNGEVSEKAGSGSSSYRLSGPEKGGWEPVGPSERKFVLGGLHWRQRGVYSLPSGGQKVYSGPYVCPAGAIGFQQKP